MEQSEHKLFGRINPVECNKIIVENFVALTRRDKANNERRKNGR
jgi:hypothetical protein